MRLTEYQLIHLIPLLSEKVVMNWDEMSEEEKNLVFIDLSEKVFPILEQLPEGATRESLMTMDDFFKEAALKLIGMRMRRSQIYKDASDFKILENISSSDLRKYAIHMMTLTIFALEVMPEDQTLTHLLENFDAYDLEAEYEQLLKTFKRPDAEE